MRRVRGWCPPDWDGSVSAGGGWFGGRCPYDVWWVGFRLSGWCPCEVW